MSKTNYKELASQILPLVGGKENVRNCYHCQTRLRFALVDEKKADTEALEALSGGCGGLFAGLTHTHRFATGSSGLPAVLLYIGDDTMRFFYNIIIALIITAVVTAVVTWILFDRKEIAKAGHPDVVVVLLTNADDYSTVNINPAGQIGAMAPMWSIKK